MNDSKVNINLGFFSILTIVFIALKLCGVIDWSWVWVLSPMWIPISLAVVCAIVYVLIKEILREKTNRRRNTKKRVHDSYGRREDTEGYGESGSDDEDRV